MPRYPLQLQTDTDKANAEVTTLTKSKDFPSQAPSQQMHKRAMSEGSLSGLDNSQPEKKESPSSTPLKRLKTRRQIDFESSKLGDDDLAQISSDQIDTSPLSVQDSMLCTACAKASLCASSKRKLDAYRARPLEPKEGELANENNEMFEKILQSKLPESLIDKTDESQKAWIKSVLSKNYVCLKPMEGYRDMPIDEMVQIEDKDDLTNCPVPNRSYKIPRALLPSLENL